MSDEIQLLHTWIDDHADDLVGSLQGVLRIPSKKEDPSGENAPYGPTIRAALDYTLDLCSNLGFTVKDVDGHAGHAEFGIGEEIVAALGHLDVVPEGDRWEHDPYGAVIENGYIYARGASDDKGPTYAALFGAKALMDSGLPIRRKIRVIFGCDEESGFGCVHHYFEVAKEQRPAVAFTPDAHFPLIYAEKGISNITVSKPVGSSGGDLRLVSAEGGRRTNMVPDFATATLTGTTTALLEAVSVLNKFWDKNITFELTSTSIIVKSVGKSAHGSTPTVGDNAVARLVKCLAELNLPEDRDWLNWIAISVDPTGTALGIAGKDDVAGPLTSNLGVFELKDGVVTAIYNIRYCITWTIDDLIGKARPTIEAAGWTIADYSDSPSLYVPLDAEPAKTLMRVYQQETGDYESKPIAIGGGTYARATPNAVCFGASFPDGDDGPAHEPEEKIAISGLLRAAKIYAHAFYELAR